MSFIADAVIVHLRQGNEPTAEDAKELNMFGIIDSLRECVTDADLPWILKRVEATSDSVSALYLGLLHKFATRDETRELLRSAWQDAEPHRRCRLMWRLLDDPELPDEWHEKIFAFVRSEPESFANIVLQFHGNADQVLPDALRRLGDPKFPPSKKWAYLCAAAACSSNREAAQALLVLAERIDHPFTQHVARTLLQDLA